MPGNFDRLAQLAPGDAQGFVRLRHALIAELIARPEFDAGRFTALQREIDCRRAAALTSRQAMDVVLQLLDERVAELKQLSEKLAQACAITPT